MLESACSVLRIYFVLTFQLLTEVHVWSSSKVSSQEQKFFVLWCSVWVWHLVNFSCMWSNCQHCSKHDIVYLECKLTRKSLKNFLLSVSISNFILHVTGLKVPHAKMLHAQLSANFWYGSSVFHFLLLSTNQNCISSTVQSQHSGYLPWFQSLSTLNTFTV